MFIKCLWIADYKLSRNLLFFGSNSLKKPENVDTQLNLGLDMNGNQLWTKKAIVKLPIFHIFGYFLFWPLSTYYFGNSIFGLGTIPRKSFLFEWIKLLYFMGKL